MPGPEPILAELEVLSQVQVEVASSAEELGDVTEVRGGRGPAVVIGEAALGADADRAAVDGDGDGDGVHCAGPMGGCGVAHPDGTVPGVFADRTVPGLGVLGRASHLPRTFVAAEQVAGP